MAKINNETIEYGQLTKDQKLAIFMITLGPENASQLLRNFDDNEVEVLCREIASMNIVDQDLKDQVMNEFIDVIGSSLGSILGGMGFARHALEVSRGHGKATNIMGRITPGGTTSDLIKEIKEMDPRKIFNLIRYEQSQTIAFLISHMPMEKAAEMVRLLPDEKRQEVMEFMGDMGSAPLEMVARVAQAIKPQLDKGEEYGLFKSGGVKMVAELLNVMDKDVGKAFLTKLEDSNPDLATLISKKMFSFDDLQVLSIADLQRVSREVEMSDLVLALKTASNELKDMILKSVSKRAAEGIKEEMEMLGPVKVKEVEEAQDRIIKIVKRLEEEGAIDLDQGGGDVVA